MTAIQVFNQIDGKYTFNFDDFSHVLQNSMDSLVAFYTIAGPFRMGKSFMLGFFHRYLTNRGYGDWVIQDVPQSFAHKCGSDRETVGIWMWSEPFIRVVNGEKVHIFLMDTQGCFDDETEMKENAIIFALSTLLSSVMIFNISRQLSEDILNFFEYFAGYTRLAADDDNRDEPFQKLLFLIRDWQYPDYEYGYYDDKSDINGRNYKRDKFNVRNSMASDVKYIHESIMSLYENVAFYLMPHPGKAVARFGVFDVDKVDEEFLEHLREFVPKVLKSQNILHKKVNGLDVNGRTLITFVRRWVEIYESDIIPETKTIFLKTVELQNEMAKTAAFNHYTRRMNDRISDANGMTAIDFNIFDKKIFIECKDIYKSISGSSGKAYNDDIIETLKEGISMLRNTCRELNRDKYETRERLQKDELRYNRHYYQRDESVVDESDDNVNIPDPDYDEGHIKDKHDELDVKVTDQGVKECKIQEQLIENKVDIDDNYYAGFGPYRRRDGAIIRKLKEALGVPVQSEGSSHSPKAEQKRCVIS